MTNHTYVDEDNEKVFVLDESITTNNPYANQQKRERQKKNPHITDSMGITNLCCDADSCEPIYTQGYQTEHISSKPGLWMCILRTQEPY